jgi:putative aldouronate transport system permease protein
MVLGISFTDNEVLKQGYRVIPRVFDLSGYKFAASSGSAIIRAYGITIFSTVAGTAFHVALCSMFAYPLSRPEFRYRKFFTVYILIPMLFTGGMVPWYVVCSQVLHIKDTIFALIIPSLFSTWNVIVLRTFLRNNIPESIVESARLDGSTEMQTYLRIVLPLSKAGLATIGFMVALAFWNDYYLSLMLIDDPKMYNLQYMLYQILNKIRFLQTMSMMGLTGSIDASAQKALRNVPQETARMAMCVITVGPIIFAYPFFQKHFVKGLTIGAVKG